MLSLAHTLISVPFGIYFDNPLLIFLAAFLFHFFADTLLHWNVYPEKAGTLFYPLAFLDVASGLASAWLIVGSEILAAPILLAILAGNLPDILQVGWNILPGASRERLAFLQPAFTFHDKLQYETTNMLHGLVSQTALIALAITVSLFRV